MTSKISRTCAAKYHHLSSSKDCHKVWLPICCRESVDGYYFLFNIGRFRVSAFFGSSDAAIRHYRNNSSRLSTFLHFDVRKQRPESVSQNRRIIISLSISIIKEIVIKTDFILSIQHLPRHFRRN
jgi:hypothetical protein